MSIQSIYSLQEEVTKLLVAGSRSGIENRKLKKYSEIFQQAGKKSKVFVMVQQAIDRLLASTETESPHALAKLLTITTSLLTVLSKSEVEEEQKRIEPIATPLTSSSLTYNQMDAMAIAGKKGSDKLKELVAIYSDKSIFNRKDPRLFKLLNGDLGSQIASTLSPKCNDRDYARYMLLGFEIADSEFSRSNFRYIRASCNDDLSDIARRILNSDAKRLYALAVSALGDNLENEQELMEYSTHKNKTIAKEALLSLVRMNAKNEQKLIAYTKNKNKDVVKDALLRLVQLESKEVKPIIRAFIKKGKISIVGDAIIALKDIGLVEELCDYINSDIATWEEAERYENGNFVIIENTAKIKLKIREIVKVTITLAHFHTLKIEQTIFRVMFSNASFLSLLINEYDILSDKVGLDYYINLVSEWDNIDYIKNNPKFSVMLILYTMRENKLYHDLLYQFVSFSFRQTLSMNMYSTVWYQYFALGWLVSTYVVINGAASLFDDCIGYIEEIKVSKIISLKDLLHRVYQLDDRFINREMTIDPRFLPLMVTEPGDIYGELKWVYPRLTNTALEEEPDFDKFLQLEKQNFFSHIPNLQKSKGFYFEGVKPYGAAQHLGIIGYVHSLLEKIKLPEIEKWAMDVVLEGMKYKEIFIGNLVEELDEQYPEMMQRLMKNRKYRKIGSKFADNRAASNLGRLINKLKKE